MSFYSITNPHKEIPFKTLFEKIMQNRRIVKKKVIQEFQECNDFAQENSDLKYKSISKIIRQ